MFSNSFARDNGRFIRWLHGWLQVSCEAGADVDGDGIGEPCENGGVVVGTAECGCDCAATGFGGSAAGFIGSHCQDPTNCTGGPGGDPCQNGGLPTGKGLACGCDCRGTGFSGAHCILSAEAVGRASQIMEQVRRRVGCPCTRTMRQSTYSECVRR